MLLLCGYNKILMMIVSFYLGFGRFLANFSAFFFIFSSYPFCFLNSSSCLCYGDGLGLGWLWSLAPSMDKLRVWSFIHADKFIKALQILMWEYQYDTYQFIFLLFLFHLSLPVFLCYFIESLHCPAIEAGDRRHFLAFKASHNPVSEVCWYTMWLIIVNIVLSYHHNSKACCCPCACGGFVATWNCDLI